MKTRIITKKLIFRHTKPLLGLTTSFIYIADNNLFIP